MKTRFVALLGALFIAAATLWWAVAPADAQRLPPKRSYSEDLGNVVSDTVVWFASGTIPGVTQNRDTLIANAPPDTSFPISIQGAESVIVEILSRTMSTADSVNVLYRFAVGNSPDTLAMWHTLSVTYNALPAVNANDTLVEVLQTDIFRSISDTSAATALATSEVGMRTQPAADRAQVRGMRYLRLYNDGQATTGDTNIVTAIVTRRYPGH